MNQVWARWLVIGRRINVAGSIVSLIALLAFSSAVLYARYEKSGESIDANANDVVELLRNTTSILVWNFDAAGLEGVRSSTKIAFIDGINWKDKDGKPVIPAASAEKIAKSLVSSAELIHKGEKIGTIEVFYNKKSQLQEFVADAKAFLVGILLVIFIQIAGVLGALWANRRMVGSLGVLVKQIQQSSALTFEKSDTIKQTASSVSSLAVDQQSSVHETMSTLEEIRHMMASSGDNIEKSFTTAEEGNRLAQEGKSVVEQMIAAVEAIKASNQQVFDKVNEGNKQIQGIVQMIRDISQKTKVINEIVFQTKLLSFNASVEAARAGEHGRGFAVVAEEVGNLAAMSGKAAQEIDHLLSESVRTTEGIVERTAHEIGTVSNAGRGTLESGVALANRCGQALAQLAQQAEDLKNRMAAVRQASKEQSIGIENISAAMEKIREATSKNADNAGVADEVSDSLLSEAKNLSTVVEYMEQALFGKDGAGAAQEQLKKAS